ncbi:MAG: hypothetical protein EBU70_15700, partial [Actinobacteria bacterium]|nr:hypothetical protein [Actinomycetota bacterium]
MFRELSATLDHTVRTRRDLLSALVGPALQLVLAILVVGFLIWVAGAIRDGDNRPVDILGLGLVGATGLTWYLGAVAALAVGAWRSSGGRRLPAGGGTASCARSWNACRCSAGPPATARRPCGAAWRRSRPAPASTSAGSRRWPRRWRRGWRSNRAPSRSVSAAAPPSPTRCGSRAASAASWWRRWPSASSPAPPPRRSAGWPGATTRMPAGASRPRPVPP